jgi:hypothetical protein
MIIYWLKAILLLPHFFRFSSLRQPYYRFHSNLIHHLITLERLAHYTLQHFIRLQASNSAHCKFSELWDSLLSHFSISLLRVAWRFMPTPLKVRIKWYFHYHTISLLLIYWVYSIRFASLYNNKSSLFWFQQPHYYYIWPCFIDESLWVLLPLFIYFIIYVEHANIQ